MLLRIIFGTDRKHERPNILEGCGALQIVFPLGVFYFLENLVSACNINFSVFTLIPCMAKEGDDSAFKRDTGTVEQ